MGSAILLKPLKLSCDTKLMDLSAPTFLLTGCCYCFFERLVTFLKCSYKYVSKKKIVNDTKGAKIGTSVLFLRLFTLIFPEHLHCTLLVRWHWARETVFDAGYAIVLVEISLIYVPEFLIHFSKFYLNCMELLFDKKPQIIHLPDTNKESNATFQYSVA